MTVCNIEPSLTKRNLHSSPTVFSHVAMPAIGLKVCVIVPARNEEDNLPICLSALYQQVNEYGKPLDKTEYEVLLLINNSNDNSLDVAQEFQEKHPDFALHVAYLCLPKEKANIGTVRRTLMDEAYRRLQLSSSHGIIASTDSDTIVDERWVCSIMQEIGKGADAVGGRILTQTSKHPVRLWHLRDVMYRTLLSQAEVLVDPCIHDPWPRHHQYFGASMAVTSIAYERAGRLPEVPFLEDYALFEALKTVDARIRRSNVVRAYTSDRQQGRVQVGFSEQLTTWSKFIDKKKIQVTEPVAPQVLKWKCKKHLRQLYLQHKEQGSIGSRELAMISRPLQLPINWLQQQMEACNYFGKLWQNIEKRLIINKWNEQWLPQPITEAIAELRQFIFTQR